MNDIKRQMRRALLSCLTLGLFTCATAFAPAAVEAQEKTQNGGGNAQAARAKAARPDKDVAYYSCPMHPEVKAAKAGECPLCHMKLRAVNKQEAAGEAANASNNTGASSPDAAPVETADGHVSKMNIPDVEVLDQDGKKLHFYTDLVRGRTVAINFIFTTCTTICPPLGATFARVRKELADRAGRDVHLISISIDPATDTPERMKAWGAKFHAGAGWTFVTGNKPQVDELLRALGASSARREDHSPALLIGNDARDIWTRAYGLAKPSQILQIINDTFEGKTASTSMEASK
jgi:cytochrome oxidase Cu insertion factor (SCO1/SenC/PrrC family)